MRSNYKTMALAVLASVCAGASYASEPIVTITPSSDASGGIFLLLMLGAVVFLGGRNGAPQTTRDAAPEDESKVIMKF